MTSLPTPPNLIDPASLDDKDAPAKGNEGEGGEDADELMGEPGQDAEDKEEPEIAKPAQGEVRWWHNNVEVGGSKGERYKWGGVGSEYLATRLQRVASSPERY